MSLKPSAKGADDRVLRWLRMLLWLICGIACNGTCRPWQFSGSCTACGFCSTGAWRLDFLQEPSLIGDLSTTALRKSTYSRFFTRVGSCRSSLPFSWVELCFAL